MITILWNQMYYPNPSQNHDYISNPNMISHTKFYGKRDTENEQTIFLRVNILVYRNMHTCNCTNYLIWKYTSCIFWQIRKYLKCIFLHSSRKGRLH